MLTLLTLLTLLARCHPNELRVGETDMHLAEDIGPPTMGLGEQIVAIVEE